MLGMRGSDVEAQNPESPEKHSDAEKPTASEKMVDFDGDNVKEDAMEEEVEYEVEEEEVKEEDTEGAANGDGVDKGLDGEDEKKKHAELLALPPHGSTVHIGGIPHDASEEDLTAFCQSVGDVSEVKIMKGKVRVGSKCYAFVTFKTKEMASEAIDKLNMTKFQGNEIKCSTSLLEHRLFIGNVPRNWTEQNLRKAVTEIGPGVNSIKLFKEHNSACNRGFAFIDYYNHACADYSRQKMSNPKFKLDNNAPTVNWALWNADSSPASQVKTLYVSNLPENITPYRLKGLFEHHGKITKVELPPAKAGLEKRRFGFVHFAETSGATKALNNTEKYEVYGQVLNCSLARQQADRKSPGKPNSQNLARLPTYPPHTGYGMVGGAHGAMGAAYGGASFTQPLVYGRGATSAGLLMMPMLLPYGRIEYVLQQPWLQQQQQQAPSSASQGGSNSGRSSSGGKYSNDKNRSRYHPY
ncbi:heterogeneous nuclear ribonucleoprotein Q [Senna tora]|uniref:Heterogeneous nuclear ribonucleoprotein Q n=1 Tax=Senna tora TaxID=362788 RepID=A0A834SIK7_9FABA|nr:heterogeneous nuclear ribonucleoprotein Q [Senna tora]